MKRSRREISVNMVIQIRVSLKRTELRSSPVFPSYLKPGLFFNVNLSNLTLSHLNLPYLAQPYPNLTLHNQILSNLTLPRS